MATVIAPYTAAGKEQLTLQKGQMILVRKRTETGWWQGEIQASGTGTKGRKRQIGWFPASYVKLLGGGGASEKPAAEKSDEKEETTKKPQYRALYTYAGQHDDELAFNAGDIISLISKDEEAWWKGELDGRVGVFPSNYVEELNCKYFFFRMFSFRFPISTFLFYYPVGKLLVIVFVLWVFG